MEFTEAKQTNKKLTFKDATKFNFEVIQKWKPASEVWPFLYGPDTMGCMTVASSIFITHSFRKQLKIIPYARMSCYFPAVGLSAIGSYMFHSSVIFADIMEHNLCPLCITTKASISQFCFGIVFPLFTATSACFYAADRLLTYPMPPLTKAPKEVFNLLQKLLQKTGRPILFFSAAHMLAALLFTHQQIRCARNLEMKAKQGTWYSADLV